MRLIAKQEVSNISRFKNLNLSTKTHYTKFEMYSVHCYEGRYNGLNYRMIWMAQGIVSDVELVSHTLAYMYGSYEISFGIYALVQYLVRYRPYNQNFRAFYVA